MKNNNKFFSNSNDSGKKKINITNISIFILFFISILSIGCLLFFNGFLLMRFELPLKSTCNQSPLSTTTFGSTNSNGCWMDKTYNKAVIIVIDALRYDFVEKQDTNSNETSNYFHNKLTSVQSLLENKSENTLFFKFVADSPTVTMQRIKGITTGSLPTFIDVGSNFGGDAIVEDSLINQLSFNDGDDGKNGKEGKEGDEKDREFRNKIVFVGDDTWVGLFPNHFYSEYPYPSFNVKDIDTVDNGVLEHLLPTITSMDNGWDVAIAHLLGVDHVGHTFSPYHPEMIRKLNQMDTFLQTIIDNIKNDTLLILMGDHGMTSDGNHGGASIDETDAALFMYSPGIKINSSSSIPKDILKSRLSSVPLDHYNSHIPRDISQIDLVSTISLALGVPIPYGNLGSIIPELFYSSDGDNGNGWNKLFDALRINTFQIKRYIDEYSKISKDFPTEKLKHFQQLLESTESLYTQYTNGGKIDPILIYKGYIQYHQEVIELCRNIWATFDLFSMNCGIALIGLSILSMIVFVIKIISFTNTFDIIKFPFKSIGISTGFGLVISTLVNLIFSKSFLNISDQYSSQSITLLIPSIFSIICFIIKSPIIIKSGDSGKSTFKSTFKSFLSNLSILKFIIILIPILSFILHGVSFFSNSFIESQQGVVYFFLISNLSMVFLNLFYYKSSKWTKKDIFILAITIISLYLNSPLVWKQNSNESGDEQLLYKFIQTFYIFPIIYYVLNRVIFNEISKNGKETSNRVHHILIVVILSSIIGFWYIIQPIISNGSYGFGWFEKNILPLIIYSCSIIGITISIFTSCSINEKDNPIAQILKRLIYISIYFYLVILLLLGIDNCRSTCLMLVQTVFISWILLNVNLNSTSGGIGKYYNLMVISVIWGFLIIYHFFTSGHEYSFNKIQFDSAFIGFENHFYPRDAILVLLNTFSSFVFYSIALPILIIYLNFSRLLKSKQLVISTKENKMIENDETRILSFFNCNEILISFIGLLLFFSYNTLLICISVYGLRRHLMVWRVFAPKYIFETIQLLIVSIILLLLSIVIQYILKNIQSKLLQRIKTK